MKPPHPPHPIHPHYQVPDATIDNPVILEIMIIIAILIYLIINRNKQSLLIKQKHKTVRVGNITIAQGLYCKNCDIIRPYDMINCICEK